MDPESFVKRGSNSILTTFFRVLAWATKKHEKIPRMQRVKSQIINKEHQQPYAFRCYPVTQLADAQNGNFTTEISRDILWMGLKKSVYATCKHLRGSRSAHSLIIAIVFAVEKVL